MGRSKYQFDAQASGPMRQSQILKHLLVVGISPIVHLLHRMAVRLVCICWRNQVCGETHRGERYIHVGYTRKRDASRPRVLFHNASSRAVTCCHTRIKELEWFFVAHWLRRCQRWRGNVCSLVFCSLMSSRRAVLICFSVYTHDQEKDRKQRENHRADFWDVDVIDNSKPRSPARPQASTRKPDPCGVVLTARHTPIPPSIAPSFINQFDFESDDDSGQRLRSTTYFRLRTKPIRLHPTSDAQCSGHDNDNNEKNQIVHISLCN